MHKMMKMMSSKGGKNLLKNFRFNWFWK
jgi:hypothetical protein